MYHPFSFDINSSTSIPWTAHASSNVSICDAGHPKQCIPISNKISDFSGAFSNISPIVSRPPYFFLLCFFVD